MELRSLIRLLVILEASLNWLLGKSLLWLGSYVTAQMKCTMALGTK